MRQHGTLAKWNDDRGFGFIEVAHGRSEIFVHVSAFPRDGVRPRIGELLSFEVDEKPDGKRQATAIRRPGAAYRRAPADGRRGERGGRSIIGSFVLLAALVAMAAALYDRYGARTPPSSPADPAPVSADPAPRTTTASAAPTQAPTTATYAMPSPKAPAAPAAPSPRFVCDGRTHCSQMRSCAEAEFFLAHCPGVRMDGNGDGEPCEQQWCD